MAKYEWLAERKAQAMKEKLAERGMPSYRQLPISEKYGVSFTGYGRNGKLDRRAPAQIDINNGQEIMLHEGENKANLPEGTLVINADVSKMAGMTPEDKMVSELYGSEGELPGMACGGYMKKFNVGGFSPALAGQIRPLANLTAKKMRETLPEYQSGGWATGIAERIKETMSKAIPTIPTSPQATTPTTQATATQPTGLAGQQVIAPAIAPAQPIQTPQTQPVSFQIPQAQAQPRQVTVAPIAPKITTAPAPQTMKFEIPTGLEGQRAVETKVPTTEEKAREESMKYLLNTLTGESSPLTLEGKRAANELSLRQQQERSALEQKLMQQGADPGRARVESNMLRDKQESELNDLAAQYGIAGMKQKQEVAGALATQGLAGERFEEEKKQTELKNKLDQASLLLSAGGEGNIQQAAQIYNEAYPGLGIDFTKVITADKAATFNNGMSALASYVQSGLDYEEALNAMKADGTFQMMGLPENQIEGLYRSLKVNVIDEQWNAISESEWYQNLPESTKQDMQAFFTAIQTGEVDYDINYSVKDSTGKTMKTFNNKDDATAFASANPGYTVSSVIVPRSLTEEAPTTTETGTTGGAIPAEEIPTKPDGSTYAQGEYFVKEGKLYKVGTDNTGIEAKEIPEDVTGTDARAIVAAGKEGNPLYTPLMDAIREAAKDETITFEDINGLTADDPIYQTIMQNTPAQTYNSLWSKEGDTYKLKMVKINIPGLGEVLARYEGNWNSQESKGSAYFTDQSGKKVPMWNVGEAFKLPDGRNVAYYTGGHVIVEGVKIV